MDQRRNILVIEPSLVVRCGIVTLLQRAAMPNVTIAESSDLPSASSFSPQSIPDILIVNPTSIGGIESSVIRSNLYNDNLKIISLQSSLVDQGALKNFDDIISIYDSMETIEEKVLKLAEDKSDSASSKKELTQREKEIIICVVKGMTNKQIADLLMLSSHTIIAHRRNIANKLQIHSLSGLTIYAIVNKLVDINYIQKTMMQNKEVEV